MGARVLIILAVFAVAACTQTTPAYRAQINSLEDHDPSRGLVLFNVDIQTPNGRPNPTWTRFPEPAWQNISLDENVDRKRTFYGFGTNGQVLLYSTKPGIHRLFFSTYKEIYFWNGKSDRHIMFYVEPGEVIYIGKIFYTWDIPPGKFSIKVLDGAQEARDFLDANFPELKDKMEVRLARYVLAPGLEKPFSDSVGMTGEDAKALEQSIIGLQNYWLLNR